MNILPRVLEHVTLMTSVRFAALSLLSACAGQGVTKTGFLSSYEGMAPTATHTDDLIFLDTAFDPASYRSLVIAPIGWSPAPNSPPRNPEVIEQLKADFRKSLEERLSKHFTILAEPMAQPGTQFLRVRAAITNTRQAHWWINAPVTVAGIGLAVVGVPAGGLPAPDPGGASEEMEVLDATTGKRLVAIATYNNAMPWNKIGEFQQFGHARRAFRMAAELLEEQLTQVHTDSARTTATAPGQPVLLAGYAAPSD